MKKTDKDKLTLNGKEYVVIEMTCAMCPSCERIHRMILLESYLTFDTGTLRHQVPKRSYYCTATGFLFADLYLQAWNKDAIRAVFPPFTRGNVPIIFQE